MGTSLHVQDTLLVHEVVAGIPQKPKERRLFLFEQIIIFSEMIERKKGDFSNASYIYKNSVKVMSLVSMRMHTHTYARTHTYRHLMIQAVSIYLCFLFS